MVALAAMFNNPPRSRTGPWHEGSSRVGGADVGGPTRAPRSPEVGDGKLRGSNLFVPTRS